MELIMQEIKQREREQYTRRPPRPVEQFGYPNPRAAQPGRPESFARNTSFQTPAFQPLNQGQGRGGAYQGGPQQQRTSTPPSFGNQPKYNENQNQPGGFRGDIRRGRGRMQPNFEAPQPERREHSSQNFNQRQPQGFSQPPKQFPLPDNPPPSSNDRYGNREFGNPRTPRNDGGYSNNESKAYSGQNQPFRGPDFNRGGRQNFNNFASNPHQGQRFAEDRQNSRGRGRGRGRGTDFTQYQDTRNARDVPSQRVPNDRVNKFAPRGNHPSQQSRGDSDTYTNSRYKPAPEVRQNQTRYREKSEKEESQAEQSAMGSEGEESYSSSASSEQEQSESLAKSAKDENEGDSQSEDAENEDEMEQASGSGEISYSASASPVNNGFRNKSKSGAGSKRDQERERMCSRKEFENRMVIFKENNNGSKIDAGRGDPAHWKVLDPNLNLDTSKSFSWFQINKRTNLPDSELALKKFQRSANREDQSELESAAYVPRSKEGLIKTMKHIKQQILDCQAKQAKELAFPIPPGQKRIEFIQVYMFLWDRMREMIKDITRLDEDVKSDREMLHVCEEITRFFILSINQGRKKYTVELDFDDKMNKESLTKIMTPLLGIYSDAKVQLNKLIKSMEENQEEMTVCNVQKRMEQENIYISPNEPEITSYAILFSDDIRKYLYENLFVGFELKDHNPLFQSRQIQQVLQIKSALTLKNYGKYFEILDSPDYDYLTSCLLSLNVDGIRKQICDRLDRSHKYREMDSVAKGVDERQFRKLLRFPESQNTQYKKFLRHVNFEVSSNGFVRSKQDAHDDEFVYKSAWYPALDEKLKRKYFIPDADSAGEQSMRKSEIVSRSWFKSTYVEELISSLMGKQYIKAAEVPRPVASKVAISKSNLVVEEQIASKGQAESQVATTNANDQLKKKMEMINRKKFLENLSTKLSNLFKPDQTKEEKRFHSLSKIFGLAKKVAKNNLIDSINSIEVVARSQLQKEVYLAQLNQFVNLKKKFVNQFTRNSAVEFIEKTEPKGMSSLLNKKEASLPFMQSKRPGNLIQVIKNNNLKTFNLKIGTDVSRNEQSYQSIEAIINNLFKFLIGPLKLLATVLGDKDYVYVEGQIRIRVSLLLLEGSDKDWSELLGADGLIYLQTKPIAKNLENALARMKKLRNAVKIGNSQNLVPVSVIRLIDSKKQVRFENLGFKPSHSCVEFIRACSLQVGPSLCLGLIGFLNSCSSAYIQRPALEVRSARHLVAQIQQNCDYMSHYGEEGQEMLFLSCQEYINMCLEQMLKLSKSYYLQPLVFQNWTELVARVCHDSEAPALEEQMRTQYNQLENLQAALKLASPFEALQSKIILDKADFALHYFNYLSKFDFGQELDYAQAAGCVEVLGVEEGQIAGDVIEFYRRILDRLGGFLANFMLILPVEFRFRVCVEELESRMHQLRGRIKSKVTLSRERLEKARQVRSHLYVGKDLEDTLTKADRLECRLSRHPPGSFKYERESWLREVEKKIKMQ